MNHCNRFNPAAFTAAALGVVGLTLRRFLYAFGTDDRGLLVSRHPLSIALWLLTLGSLGYLLFFVYQHPGSDRYEDNFSPSPAAALGHLLAALGIGLTVLTCRPPMEGFLAALWGILGILSALGLLLAGFQRLRGDMPFFLTHALVCLFFMVHVVVHYQSWSSDPQLQDYLAPMLGAMGLMFFAYYTAALEAGCGRRRMQMGSGLTAGFFCLVSLAGGDYPLLYLGCACWALTNLCRSALPGGEPA